LPVTLPISDGAAEVSSPLRVVILPQKDRRSVLSPIVEPMPVVV
jgi:hypothetical protein